jgi:hypothetical protein
MSGVKRHRQGSSAHLPADPNPTSVMPNSARPWNPLAKTAIRQRLMTTVMPRLKALSIEWYMIASLFADVDVKSISRLCTSAECRKILCGITSAPTIPAAIAIYFSLQYDLPVTFMLGKTRMLCMLYIVRP